jgi:hypothetical protein
MTHKLFSSKPAEFLKKVNYQEDLAGLITGSIQTGKHMFNVQLISKIPHRRMRTEHASRPDLNPEKSNPQMSRGKRLTTALSRHRAAD